MPGMAIIKMSVTMCICVVILICYAAAFSSVYAQQNTMPLPQFFSALKDVPLMDGLSELPEHDIVFDKPQGQIVEVSAQILSVSRADIVAFYDTALPQFGWRKTPQGIFFRRNEFLEIVFERIEGQDIVKIMVRPTL